MIYCIEKDQCTQSLDRQKAESEPLQLLEFILSVEEVSLPILQKIRNDSSSNDEKAFLFLETINDDPIMISALRRDKEQHDEGNICDYCDSQYNY